MYRISVTQSMSHFSGKWQASCRVEVTLDRWEPKLSSPGNIQYRVWSTVFRPNLTRSTGRERTEGHTLPPITCLTIHFGQQLLQTPTSAKFGSTLVVTTNTQVVVECPYKSQEVMGRGNEDPTIPALGEDIGAGPPSWLHCRLVRRETPNVSVVCPGETSLVTLQVCSPFCVDFSLWRKKPVWMYREDFCFVDRFHGSVVHRRLRGAYALCRCTRIYTTHTISVKIKLTHERHKHRYT
jgi:hypothetical protein